MIFKIAGAGTRVNSPLKNGLYAADVRAADFVGLKKPVKSRGWPELVLVKGLLRSI